MKADFFIYPLVLPVVRPATNVIICFPLILGHNPQYWIRTLYSKHVSNMEVTRYRPELYISPTSGTFRKQATCRDPGVITPE